MTRIDSDLSVVIVLTGLAFAAILAYGIAEAVIGWWRRRRRIDERLHAIAAPGVNRYDGCIGCEGAEYVSRAALIRHQTAEHDGVIRWA